MKSALKKFSGKIIAVDTRSSWTYIGRVKEVGESYIQLEEVDVHDNNDTVSTKEIYLANSRKTGVITNRDTVYINFDYVVSFSPLESIKSF